MPHKSSTRQATPTQSHQRDCIDTGDNPSHLPINRYIKTLKPYIPISHKIWEHTHKKEILKLDWNESTIPPSPLVLQGLHDLLDSGFLQWYPDIHNTELYELLARYACVDSGQLEIFGGSDCAHEYILQVFLDTGAKVLIVAPTYDNFRSRAQGIGIETIFFPLVADFTLDFALLEQAIAHHAPQMVYICNPNNPTGIAYDSVALHCLIRSHNTTMFLIDEAYYEFCAQTLAPLTRTHKNLIITRTFSKAFGLASLRIGYCISHTHNIALLNKLRNPKSLSAFAQVAAIHALKDLPYMWAYVKEVRRAREWFSTQIRALGIKTYHSVANFVLLSHTHDLCELLERHHIFIRDYRHIIPNHFRITIGTHAQMQRVLEVLHKGGG